VNLLRGPCAARRSQQFKRGVPTFVNVNTSRSNDPSIMTHQAVRTRDKRLYDAPAHGIDPTQIGMCVTLLSPGQHRRAARLAEVRVRGARSHAGGGLESSLAVCEQPPLGTYKDGQPDKEKKANKSAEGKAAFRLSIFNRPRIVNTGPRI
jgi:hypothetical protein